MTSSWPRAAAIAPCSTCRRSASPRRKTRRARPMTSSPKKPGIDKLPPALSSMWRLCKLGYRHEPGLLLISFFLALLAALPDALLALWFKLLGDGFLEADYSLMRTAA